MKQDKFISVLQTTLSTTRPCIKGLWVPLITPFFQGKLDVESLHRLMDSMDASIDGYVLALSSGEGKKLDKETWKRLIQEVVVYTDKPVFAGIIGKSEEETIDWIEEANNLPCGGIVIATCYENDEKNLAYIERMHEKSSKAIMIYNTEQASIQDVQTIQAIDALEKIVAIKESSLVMDLFHHMVKLKQAGKIQLSLLQGMEHVFDESRGGDGYLISLLNTEAALCRRLFDDKEGKANQFIHPIFWQQNLGANWYISLKAILYARGVIRSAEEVVQEVKLGE